MDGDAYEQWVAGVDLDTGRKKGRVREDANALRFAEVTSIERLGDLRMESRGQ